MAAGLLLVPGQVRAQGAPNYQAAFVTGDSLVIIFSEQLDSTSVPAASQFTVTVDGGTGPTVSTVAVEGAEVRLTLGTAIAIGDDNVLVAYSKSTNNIQDPDGDEIPGQMGLAVNNHTGATNSQPTFTGYEITLTVDENTADGENVGSPVAATDNDGDVLEYELETGVTAFTLDTATGQLKASAALDYESGPTSYVFALFVTDKRDQTGVTNSVLDDSIVVTVNVNNVNEGPVITSTDITHTAISEPEGTHPTDVLATYAANDPEGDSLTWTKSGTDAVRFNINSSTGALTFQALLDYENPIDSNMDRDYNVTVEVKDGKNAQGGNDNAVDDSIDVVVTVTNIDEGGLVALPNTFRAGTPATATLSDLDGAVSGVTWQWARGNTQNGTFNNISGATSATYTPVAADVGKWLRAKADYTDPQGSGKSALGTATSAVLRGNEDPTFNEGPSTTRMVGENRPGGTHVGAAVSATDGDGDTLAYGMTGTDASSFTIVQDDGRILLKSPIIYNYEVKSSYSVTVTVTDNLDASNMMDPTIDDTIDVTINLINEDDLAMVTLAGTFQGGFPVTATLGADEDGTPTNVTWQWSRGNMAEGQFTNISGATSASYTPVRADENKWLQAKAMYTDPQGPNKSAEAVSPMAVVRGNEDPSFSSATTTRNLDEHPNPGALVGSPVSATDPDNDSLDYWLTGTDASSFTVIATNGQILIRPTPITYDYEVKSSYSVTVNVRDNKNETNMTDTVTDDTIAVTININNLDEPGTVTISGLEVGGETLTASVTDLDGAVSSLSWQWQRQQGSGSNFNNISGATSSTYAPVAADVGKRLKVKAMYTDPQGSGKSASAETGSIDAGNEDPTFDDGETTTRSVNENSATNATVGAAVEATDGDGDTLHYTLTSMVSVPISVTAGGQIVTTTPITNYESQSSYTVTLNVSDRKDNAGNSDTVVDDTITVTINIIDVNEAPAITTTQTSISVAENQTDVLTYAATDVDDNSESHDSFNTLTWSVESADDGGFFQISLSGVLTFKAPPNFEDRQDAGGDNVYNVTVTVTDNGIDGMRGSGNYLSASKSLAVTVTDVNETPTITSGPTTIRKDENTATTEVIATYVATDPDASTGVLSWDLQGNDAGDFVIASPMPGTAQLTFRNSPDFENAADTGTNNVYDVTVRVRDNAAPRLQDTRDVDVTVEDVNETPVVSGAAGPSFPEIEFDDASPTLTIGMYTATDDEGDTMSWAVTGTDATHFSITSTGVLSFSINPDFENPADLDDSIMMGASNNVYEIVVEATDDNAQGGKGGTQTGTYVVTVTVTNVDETPEITTQDAIHTAPSFVEIEFDVDDAGLTAADYLVATYMARDEEGETITWSRSGADAGDFTINSSSGVLTFNQRPNYEDPMGTNSGGDPDNTYEITVRATDASPSPNFREISVVVTVTNVNETPKFTVERSGFHTDEIEYDSGITAADMSSILATPANQSYWYDFEVQDEEGDDIIFTIVGDDAEDFVIVEDLDFVPTPAADERAIVRWKIVPNYEVPLGSSTLISSEGQGYIFTVRPTATPRGRTSSLSRF